MKTILMAFLLIYYGWPSSFNYTDNSWNPELVAQDMASYSMVVLGNGLQDPAHGDHLNTISIIERIKEINPNTKVFGYVTVNQSLNDFIDDAAAWDANMAADGIFMDEAGYDFGSTATNGREAINEKINYVHTLENSNICFVNGWNMDHIMGLENDASYPNSLYNPNLVETALTTSDWYLMENFTVVNGALESQTQFMARGDKMKKYSTINVASISVIDNNAANGQDMADFSFLGSFIFDVNVHGTSDTSYGASSSCVNFWDRPDVSDLGPNVNTKRSTCLRNFNDGRITLDFGKSKYTIAK